MRKGFRGPTFGAQGDTPHKTEDTTAPLAPALTKDGTQGDGGLGGGRDSGSRRGKPVLLVTWSGATKNQAW